METVVAPLAAGRRACWEMRFESVRVLSAVVESGEVSLARALELLARNLCECRGGTGLDRESCCKMGKGNVVDTVLFQS
jgi:hypothetical protein